MNILIGWDRETKKPIYFPLSALERHVHLIGYTGAGKTTAIITFLLALLSIPFHRKCVVIIDRLGGFSLDLLRWFASGLCPPWVRERLVYIEGAREDVTVPINPLLYGTPGEGYYRTARATEIVLRGWASQDITQMPRLARWLFNCFWAACQQGLTIGDCVHFLRPHSPLHKPLINSLPDGLKWEWKQILEAHGNQAEVQLESCRNRLTPVFEAPGLRAMFSSSKNYLDVRRWMREKKIVLINLAPLGKLPETMADTIGGLVVNEVFSVARSLEPQEREETLLVLDEFQRFVGPDLEFSLAESRQLKTSLVMSHQSFSQLVRGEVDLTSLIFQAQTRLMLKVAGLDAEVLAAELAGFTYNPLRVKDEIWRRSQRISGHKIVELQSRSQSENFARQWSETFSTGRSRNDNVVRRDSSDDVVRGQSAGRTDQSGRGKSGTQGGASTTGSHETLVPVYEEYLELASRNYYTFEEGKNEWGRDLRRLRPGQGILQIANDGQLHLINVKRSTPGHLEFDWATVRKNLPSVAEAYDRLLEENFRQECFVSPAVIEAETQKRLEQALQPKLTVRAKDDQQTPEGPDLMA